MRKKLTVEQRQRRNIRRLRLKVRHWQDRWARQLLENDSLRHRIETLNRDRSQLEAALLKDAYNAEQAGIINTG